MYLFFDVETTGLPIDWKGAIHDVDNWPRIVQIAWIVSDTSGKILNKQSRIVCPSDWIIPPDASLVHGITTEIAEKEGQFIEIVMGEFMSDVKRTGTLVAHNMAFDRKVVGAELVRLGWEADFLLKPQFCTMEYSTVFCGIPGKWGNYKWPKLEELHEKLFGETFENAHDALADIEATHKCFFEMVKRKLIVF